MPDDPYSLTDLARLADVTPRTIRYYVAQGLLPSPEAAGPSTRYGAGHLARLRLIKRLQRDHLPLAEIRARLERMGDEEVQALLDATDSVVPDPSRSGEETLSYVRALMARSGVSPRIHQRAPETAASDESAPTPPTPPIWSIPGAAVLEALKPSTGAPPAGFFIDSRAEASQADTAPGSTAPAPSPAPLVAPSPASPPAPASPSRPVAGDRSTWERLVLSPDVELHVRRPLDRLANKRVEQLARIARELFDDEP
jgi:DNA-binding transcriptional MerR regulator